MRFFRLQRNRIRGRDALERETLRNGKAQRLRETAIPLLPKDFLHLSCGGCRLCQRCAKEDGLPCRMPDKALPSLEGYCVDVYNTTKNTDLKYINGQNTVTFFGMILF